MEKDEMIKTGYDVLYLVVCAVKGVVPETEKLNRMNMENVTRLCTKHSIGGLCSFALESAGIKNETLLKEKNQTIRKVMLLDAERANICKFFEEKEIWYMPLKGVYMKEYYPKLGMRSMSDNDILVDENRIHEIDEFLKQRGYKMNSMKTQNDLEYIKAPVYNFEIHRSLFGEHHAEFFYDYYSDVKSRLIRDDESNFGYHFSDEEFYIYMIAHEYKHFIRSGTGLRSLIDTYIFNNRFKDKLDRDYIENECKKLGIAEFEKNNRDLAEKIFSSPLPSEFTESENEMILYFITSGTYGTVKNYTENMMKKKSGSGKNQTKARYIFRRIFPPMDVYKRGYPFFYKHKILLPVAWFFRLVKGMLCKHNNIKIEVKTVIEHKE